MIKIITINDIQKLIAQQGIIPFFQSLIHAVENEYKRWQHFQKSPRHAVHVDKGVIELMPTCDEELYSFKFVNGHPNNTAEKKLTVVAVGMLADVKTGYPLMISEMTLLTALRTAATSAVAAKHLARKNVKHIGIIGTGAQSEFQVMAQHALFTVETVKYFDVDPNAMKKFHTNLEGQSFTLIPCDDAKQVVQNVDMITTATASKKQSKVLSVSDIKPGLHINGIGGDCPGKTELDKDILSHTKIVVEFLPQSKVEGEIQQSHAEIYAELWEVVTGQKKGRDSDSEITLFDSVGFAIEDFAILKFIYALSEKNHVGVESDLIPTLDDPKNLFGLLV